jgi:hypothetical protein
MREGVLCSVGLRFGRLVNIEDLLQNFDVFDKFISAAGEGGARRV